MSLVVVLTEPLGLPIGFPLVPFLNGIVYRLVSNRKKANLFSYSTTTIPLIGCVFVDVEIDLKLFPLLSIDSKAVFDEK